jgi:hypothetical protein
MNNYHFNNSAWRVLLDSQSYLAPRVDRDTAINRDHVTLSNGEVFHVGGEWLDDDNNAGDLNND